MGKSLGAQGAPLSGAIERPGASVIVCTRNRGAALAPTLESLGRQGAACRWELLVVDNASTDATAELARSFAARDPERIRVATEPTLGLSAARNFGVRLARGEIIVFLDDDAEPLPGWLDAYSDALAEPGVLAAGGPVEPVYSDPLPEWLDAAYLPYLSVWDRGPQSHDLTYNELPRGTNMAFRRAAFELVGGFDARLGRAGRSLRSCEETELGLRLERSGARIVYRPAARVRHRVETARLTPEWMKARFAAQAFSEAIIDWKHFGRAGLERGAAAVRQAVERAGAAGADRGEVGWRCARAAEKAYRIGALFAIWRVERWSPPAR